jgi:hypothetical protein
MTINLLDETLQIDIFFDCDDHDLEDNVCIRVIESCPSDERLMRANETNIFLTPGQARELGEALLVAAHHSESHGGD